MNEEEKKELREIVIEHILEEIEKGNLEKDESSYEITYTEDYLNNFIMELLRNGFTTKEVMFIREEFINFELEQDITVSDTIEYEDGKGGVDWYEVNERIETVLLTTVRTDKWA